MISVSFTGLSELQNNFRQSPDVLERLIGIALGKSIGMAETQAKIRTPKDTGVLRSSIGGESNGFKYVRGLEAGVGTNIKYAIYVEKNLKARHPIGEAGYMEKGINASMDFIIKQFEGAMKELGKQLVK